VNSASGTSQYSHDEASKIRNFEKSTGSREWGGNYERFEKGAYPAYT